MDDNASRRDPRQLYTEFTLRLLDLEQAFASQFRERVVTPRHHARLTGPQGPSTGGGRLAMQHLLLAPEEAGQPTTIAGTVDSKAGCAVLRAHAQVDAQHRARFGRPAPLDRADYERFLDEVQRFLEAANVRVIRIAAQPVSSRASAWRQANREALVVALVTVAFGLVWWLAR